MNSYIYNDQPFLYITSSIPQRCPKCGVVGCVCALVFAQSHDAEAGKKVLPIPPFQRFQERAFLDVLRFVS